MTSSVPKTHSSRIELTDFVMPAAVHKYLRAQSGNFLAGTREARSVFHHQICREFFFFTHREFREGHTGFDDLHDRIQRVNNNGL